MTVVISESLGSPQATSALQAREWVARESGPFESFDAAAGSNAATVVSTVWPIRSNNDQDTLYQDHFLYRPGATDSDKTRTVRIYQPTAGALTPDLPWATAPATGERIEVIGTLDPRAMMRAINDGLKELLVQVEFTIQPILNQTRHALPDHVAAWLSEPSWIRQVGWLDLSESRDQVDPYTSRIVRGQALRSNGSVMLEHPGKTFDPTSTLVYVRAMKPAYFHCRASENGVWGDTNGLVAETDQAPVDVEWLGTAALVELWRRHSKLLDQSSNGRLVNDSTEARAWFSEQTEIHMDVPQLTFLPPPHAWGPRQGGQDWSW